MTAKAVTDDLVRSLTPTLEQVNAYTRREFELRGRFLRGVLDADMTLDGLQTLMEMTAGCINCNAQPEIPGWADKKNLIIQHILCGMVDPARLSTASVFVGGRCSVVGRLLLERKSSIQ